MYTSHIYIYALHTGSRQTKAVPTPCMGVTDIGVYFKLDMVSSGCPTRWRPSVGSEPINPTDYGYNQHRDYNSFR